ncbi:MAG TPA: acetyl-CoA C-acetyltransferase [Firmicutes bacterium]|nr:acetyl-CoA C-acetyltransferase [Bacillota bacterium]
MRETVIVSACRTPFGTFGGTLREVPAVELGAVAIKEAVARAGISPAQVQYVLMGMVVQAGAGQIPSRQAAVKAGIPPEVPTDTVNKVCASSLRCVNLADALIRAGDADIVVAGGMENMSQGPYLVPGARWGYRLWNQTLVDGTVKDGLWCAFHDVHMGVHGDRVAKDYGISREEQDSWAYRSHMLALAAIRNGRFQEEIVPVQVPQRKGPSLLFATDEAPRADTSLEKLAALRPAFGADGTITAGNAPGLNDGATALVLMSRQKAQALGLRPLATVVSQGWIARPPEEFPLTPYPAACMALERAGLSFDDVDLVEINEAFAVVALVNMKLGDWPAEKVNVNGGAVALGHPIGASGGRILTTLIYELRRRGGGLGLACICAGGGQGEVTLVRVEAGP